MNRASAEGTGGCWRWWGTERRSPQDNSCRGRGVASRMEDDKGGEVLVSGSSGLGKRRGLDGGAGCLRTRWGLL